MLPNLSYSSCSLSLVRLKHLEFCCRPAVAFLVRLYGSSSKSVHHQHELIISYLNGTGANKVQQTSTVSDLRTGCEGGMCAYQVM